MSQNSYSEVYLHMVWHTKASHPLLTPEIESVVHHYLRGRLINTPGAFVHAVGGTETHVHVVVTLAPTLLISDLIGKLKGASAHEANQKLAHGRKVLEWQTGYGVVSFGKKDLKWSSITSTIRRNTMHVARRTTGWNASRQWKRSPLK